MKDNLITDEEWLKKLSDILNKFNLKTDKLNIYIEAFTHSSFSNENSNFVSYERLEFLGDAIIEFVVSDNLFNNINNYDQGMLTTIRQKIVNAENLSKAFDKILSNDLILKGKGLKDADITENIKCDIFESFIAAVYKLEGYDAVYCILNEAILLDIKDKFQDLTKKDYKSRFQECMQKNEGTKSSQIFYKHTESKDGWICELFVDKQLYATASGRNKKESDQLAAKYALEKNPLCK